MQASSLMSARVTNSCALRMAVGGREDAIAKPERARIGVKFRGRRCMLKGHVDRA